MSKLLPLEIDTKKQYFFDNNSTTKPYPSVVKNMAKIQEYFYANPSTSYSIGKSAKEIIEDSRTTICRLLGISNPCHLTFTSGATESNNTMIRGCIQHCHRKKPKILCSQIEHSSIYETCEQLQKQHECTVEFIPVDSNGFILEDEYENLIDADTTLVCIMISNNELGTIQDIQRLVKILRKKNKNCFFLCDATQYIGKYPINIKKLDIDGMSFSGHKFSGPRGIGGMYLKEPKKIEPCNTGGSQEFHLRAGTESTSSIFGMALAMEISYRNLEKNMEKIWNMRNYMEDLFFKTMPDSRINNPSRNIHERMYSVISIILPKYKKQLLKNLNKKGIFVNLGSACNGNKKSRILSEIGLTEDEVQRTLRISLSQFNTRKECKYVVEQIALELGFIKPSNS